MCQGDEMSQNNEGGVNVLWDTVRVLENEKTSLRAALEEIRDRIERHPAYADLTEEEEIYIGGDTAELSYLARVANAALSAQRH
jgi:hypothetical protein